jgi:hypothetical protein
VRKADDGVVEDAISQKHLQQTGATSGCIRRGISEKERASYGAMLVDVAYCVIFRSVNTKMAVSWSKGPAQYSAEAAPT